MGFAEDLDPLFDALEEAGHEFMVVGGLAMDALGVPRSTVDIDIQIRLDPAELGTSSYFLGWFIDERAHDEVFDQVTLIVHAPSSPRPVELFLTDHWFTSQALDRRQHLQATSVGRAFPLPTPEDFVLLKAAYWRHLSRSPRKAAQDGVDIESVLAANLDELDHAYLEENARKLEIWDPIRGILQDLSL